MESNGFRQNRFYKAATFSMLLAEERKSISCEIVQFQILKLVSDSVIDQRNR